MGVMSRNNALDQMRQAGGTTVDVPLAAETLEDITPRSHTSLLKRAVNKLINIKALLTSLLATAGGNVAYTYTRTVINEAAGVTIDLGGNVSAQYAYLVDLVLTVDSQSTTTLRDSSDGQGGGTPVDNTGDMLFGSGGGINLHIKKNEIADRAPKSSVVNRHLELVVTEGCNGYAVVASGA